MIVQDTEAVIFDWAGTTIDYGSFAPVAAIIEAFEAFHISPTLDEVREPMGMLKRDHIQTMFEMKRISESWLQYYGRSWEEQDIDDVYNIMEAKTLEILPQYTDVKPHVLEVMDFLRERKIKVGSTTGYTDMMMEIVVPVARSKGYDPDFYATPNRVGNIGRPNPHMIYENMKQLGVLDKTKVLKVGDTKADILEGKNAGVKTVGVIEGSSIMGLKESEFRALTEEEKQHQRDRVHAIYEMVGADYIINDLSELI